MATAALIRNLRRRELSYPLLSHLRTFPGITKAPWTGSPLSSRWASFSRPFSSKSAGNDVIGRDLGTTNSRVAVMEGKEDYSSFLQPEIEKCKMDIEMKRKDFRYEDNIEKRRLHNVLSNTAIEIYDLTDKLDQELQALKAQSETIKYYVIMKCCIDILVLSSAIGVPFALLCYRYKKHDGEIQF